MSGSMSFSASTPSLSTTSTPALSANRLARPVKARSTCTPSPATAAAISAAPPPPPPPPPRPNLGARHILGHVARLQPRHHDLRHFGGFQRGDLRRADA